MTHASPEYTASSAAATGSHSRSERAKLPGVQSMGGSAASHPWLLGTDPQRQADAVMERDPPGFVEEEHLPDAHARKPRDDLPPIARALAGREPRPLVLHRADEEASGPRGVAVPGGDLRGDAGELPRREQVHGVPRVPPPGGTREREQHERDEPQRPGPQAWPALPGASPRSGEGRGRGGGRRRRLGGPPDL